MPLKLICVVTSTRCITHILSLSKMVRPLSLTVANVSKPSKARTWFTPFFEALTWGKVVLYVHDLSATHSHLSSLNPLKGSSMLGLRDGQHVFQVEARERSNT